MNMPAFRLFKFEFSFGFLGFAPIGGSSVGAFSFSARFVLR